MMIIVVNAEGKSPRCAIFREYLMWTEVELTLAWIISILSYLKAGYTYTQRVSLYGCFIYWLLIFSC